MGLSLFISIADDGIDPVIDIIASFFGNIKSIGLSAPFCLTVTGGVLSVGVFEPEISQYCPGVLAGDAESSIHWA